MQSRDSSSHIPPPSYAIIYEQHHNISTPSKDPIPLMHPEQRFDGVYITSKPPPEDIDTEESTDIEEDTRRKKAMASGGRPWKPETFDAVVVTSTARSVQEKWKRDEVMDMDE